MISADFIFGFLMGAFLMFLYDSWNWKEDEPPEAVKETVVHECRDCGKPAAVAYRQSSNELPRITTTIHLCQECFSLNYGDKDKDIRDKSLA